MSKKKKGSAEFRYYEVPREEAVLALIGNKWIQVYGENIDNMHFHNLIEIGYCHYGEGDLAIEEEQYRFGAGMVSCIPANFLHVTKSDTGVMAFWEYLYINPADLLKQQGRPAQEIRNIIDAVNSRAFFIKVEENPIFVTLIRAIFEEMQYKNPYYRECVGGMAYSLLFEIARYNGRGTAQSYGKNNSLQLENAIEYVERNFQNNFKIADLANEACDLIDKTDIIMEDVAEKVGFITPSTFNRNFRRIIGTSPYQWKKRPDNHEGKLLEYKISALKGW